MRKIYSLILCIAMIIMTVHPVDASPAALYATEGLVAALMQYYGVSVESVASGAGMVGASLSDVLEAYAASLSTTVAALFPVSSVIRLFGDTVSYGADYVESVMGLIDYLKGDSADVDIPVYSSTSITVDGRQIYKLPVTIYDGTDTNTYQVNGTGDAYACGLKGDSTDSYYNGYRYWVVIASRSQLTLRITWDNGGKTSTLSPISVDDGNYYYTMAMIKPTQPIGIDFYGYDGAQSVGWVQAEGVRRIFGDDMIESTSTIDIVGVPDLPEAVADTNIDILGISSVVGDNGTVEDVGSAVVDMIADGTLDVREQMTRPDGDVSSPGLSSVFPFCLPYDVSRLVSVLAADPVTPVIRWPIVVESWGIHETIEVDLTDWDQVAALLRTMEAIVFAVGLALVTRKWIGAQ